MIKIDENNLDDNITYKGKYQFNNINNSMGFKKIENNNLGFLNSHVWIYYQFYNNKKSTKKYLQIFPEYLEYVDIYIVDENKTKIIKAGKFRNFPKELTIKDSGIIVPINFNHGKTEIFIRIKTHLNYYFKIHLSQPEYYLQNRSLEWMWYGMLGGILLFVSIFYFTIGLFTKEKLYIYYSGMFFFQFLYNFDIYGFNKYFFEYLPINNQYHVSILYLAISLIFTYLFFEEVTNFRYFFPKIFKTLKLSIITILSSLAILSFFYIQYTLTYLIIFSQLLLIFTLIFSLYIAFIKKYSSAKFYFYGTSILVVTTIYQFSSFFQKIVPFEEDFTIYAGEYAILLDLILLSFALSKRINMINREKEKNKKLLFNQSKMVTIAQTINNISHQWRQPLSELSALNLRLDSKLYINEIPSYSFLKEYSKNSNNIINFLSKTIDVFSDLNSTKVEKTSVNLKETIKNILNLYQDTFTKYNIEIKINIDDNISIFIDKKAFYQIILTILNNAKDELIHNNIKNPKIIISSKQYKNYLELYIEDNGNGIKKEYLNEIFKPYFSTKGSSGLGLYIAKTILEIKLKGSIKASNLNSGVKFTLKFN